MELLEYGKFVGERALFASRDTEIRHSVFCDGESPLKESRNIRISDSVFKWKYPLWYCNTVEVSDTSLLETARSGIWYTHGIQMKNCLIEAPKTFRRSSGIRLEGCQLQKASETLWSCKDVELIDVTASGDYFGMNSENIYVENFNLSGNYAFDGAKNIEVRRAKMLSKDAFWNCENVTVYDSVIIGEYLGWNSKNVTFLNCTVESDQGLCYMENVTMINCKLLNTPLAFEYSSANAEITSHIDSVKNPKSGKISAKSIGELIMDDRFIDPAETVIELTEEERVI